MHLDSGKLAGKFIVPDDNSDSSDISQNNDRDDASNNNTSDSGSDIGSDSDSDSDMEYNGEPSNKSTNCNASGAGSSGQNQTLSEDEEDEVVKAIIRSKEFHRTHPPPITLDDFVVDVSFHPNEELIAAANILGDVLLYKYSNEKTDLLGTMELHLRACRDIEFSFDGRTLFSTAKDLSVMLTDLDSEKLIRLYENAHEQPVYTMTILGEHTFATGDDDGVVKLWDLREKGTNPVFSLKCMEDYVSDIVTNDESKYLVCSSGDGSLTTFNMPARKLHVQSVEYEEELLCLGLFKLETKLLAATSKGKMYVFNWGEFGLHSDEFPSLTKKPLNCMIPITENVVVTGGDDGILRAISLFPHRQLGIVGQHDFPVEALDINSDGTLIVSSSHNNDIKFWNVKYFETLNTSEHKKGGKQKQMKHNLPSSQVDNASNFFADL